MVGPPPSRGLQHPTRTGQQQQPSIMRHSAPCYVLLALAASVVPAASLVSPRAEAGALAETGVSMTDLALPVSLAARASKREHMRYMHMGSGLGQVTDRGMDGVYGVK